MFFLLVALLCLATPVRASEPEEVKELPEIVVTATKTPHSLKDVPVETLVIDRQEIEDSSALTVSDLLRYSPGIFVRAEDLPGISAWRTRIRGLDLNNGYGLVLIDGQRVKGGGMGEYGYGLNQIPLELIDRIEVVKGPGSVLYGSDAVVGVVNIITRPAPTRTFFNGSALYGSYKTKMVNLTGGGPLGAKGSGILLSLDREEADRRKYGGPGDHYRRDHFWARASQRLGRDLSLGLTFKWEERDRDYAEEEKLRLAPSLNWTLRNGDQVRISGYLYNWDFHHFTPGYTERKGNMAYRQAEIQLTRAIFPGHQLTLGGEFLEEELDYNLATKTIDTRSLFLQDEIRAWGERLSLVVGGRYDDHSVFGSQFSPRIAAMVAFDESTKIRASLGRSFKSPTIRQLYYKEPFLHGSYYIKSNPRLDPETSWGVSLGLEKVFGRGLWTSISLFRHDLEDMVVRVETNETIGGIPVRTYENVQEAYTEGVELALKGRLGARINLNLSYTYLETENKDTGKDLPYSPRHTLALGLEYRGLRGFKARLGTQFVDRVYTNTSNTKELDSYWLTEIKITQEINSQMEVFMEIDNLFETNYGEPSRDWAGRSLFLGTRLKF
ncbi:TonB-dependent receptor plug domain-containing protein [Thermosulfuriphilus sp.]